MTRHPRTLQLPASHLVSRLLDNPQLPGYLASLPSQALAQLVNHVGKEDAQALLVYATDAQIQDLIETDTWHAPEPGLEEQFDPEKFLEWLELWKDMSPRFLADKVQALGSEMFALALNHYVVVVDLGEVGVSATVDTFHEFGVMPRDEEQWDVLFELLVTLWHEDTEFLEECLARCCQRRSLTVEKTHITENENLQSDVAGNRDRHRRDQGYVTSTSAAAFLHHARNSPYEALLIEVAYDPYSAMQLRASGSQHRSASTPNHSAGSAAEMHATTATPPANEAWQELDALLQSQAIFASPQQVLLLEDASAESQLFIRHQLRLLERQDPDALQVRLNELLYLANILMEGTTVQGQRLGQREAMNGVYALCNLGLTHCIEAESWGSADEIVQMMLLQEPGLIKAFHLGYHLSGRLQTSLLNALRGALTSGTARRLLRPWPWIQDLVTEAMAQFGESVSAGRRQTDLQTLLEALTLVADNTACTQCRILGDALPCLPLSLAPETIPDLLVDTRWRYIATTTDLGLAAGFIDTLEARLFA